MSKEAMKLALEALEKADRHCPVNTEAEVFVRLSITALREALANEALDKMAENARQVGLDYEPAQQEPVSLEDSLKESKVCCGDYAKCHRACTPRGRWEALRLVETAQPAQRTWVGLTDEEIEDIEITWEATQEWDCFRYAARAIEAKLKEKNT